MPIGGIERSCHPHRAARRAGTIRDVILGRNETQTGNGELNVCTLILDVMRLIASSYAWSINRQRDRGIRAAEMIPPRLPIRVKGFPVDFLRSSFRCRSTVPPHDQCHGRGYIGMSHASSGQRSGTHGLSEETGDRNPDFTSAFGFNSSQQIFQSYV